MSVKKGKNNPIPDLPKFGIDIPVKGKGDLPHKPWPQQRPVR